MKVARMFVNFCAHRSASAGETAQHINGFPNRRCLGALILAMLTAPAALVAQGDATGEA